jgi:hypothetical protein
MQSKDGKTFICRRPQALSEKSEGKVCKDGFDGPKAGYHEWVNLLKVGERFIALVKNATVDPGQLKLLSRQCNAHTNYMPTPSQA